MSHTALALPTWSGTSISQENLVCSDGTFVICSMASRLVQRWQNRRDHRPLPERMGDGTIRMPQDLDCGTQLLDGLHRPQCLCSEHPDAARRSDLLRVSVFVFRLSLPLTCLTCPFFYHTVAGEGLSAAKSVTDRRLTRYASRSFGVFETLTVTYAAELAPVSLRPVLTAYVNLCWVSLICCPLDRALSRSHQRASRLVQIAGRLRENWCLDS